MATYHPISATNLSQEAEPWTPGTDMSGVLVAGYDKANGSPKHGDMVLTFHNGARSLYSKKFFEENYTDKRP